MANSGLKHADVGDELSKAEWLSDESHELVHGTSFPGSPTERQLFYRDDEHKWYIFTGSSWTELTGAGGGGDMLKSVYDTDDDGVVDNSEKLEGSTKAQVQNHAPQAHKTSHQDGGSDEISIDGLAGEPLALTTHAADKDAHHSNILTLTFIIDGGGSAITTGEKGHLHIPFDCTIAQVTLLADQTGSIVIDIWKDGYGFFPPTDADSITGSSPPTISSAQKSQDSTLSGWTTYIYANDVLAFNVDSCTAIEKVTLSLRVEKS